MKKCPQCGTEYSDVTLSFCLQDGTPLVTSPQADTPTVVLGETDTVVRGGQVRVPIGEPDSGKWSQSQVTNVASSQPTKKGPNTAWAVGLTVVGMLLLFGIIGVAAIVFLRNSQQASVNNMKGPNTNMGGSTTNYSTPYTMPSPVQTPPTTPSYTPRSSPATTPPPPVLSSYPSTTRLKFARGSYTTSFSGDINPGDTRSLVLACRSGQSLSANVLGSSCVTIRGGSSLRTTTSSGDNYITITSTCSSVAHFSVSITII
jgi:hypothetical protein